MRFRQLRRSPWRALVDQTGHALPQETIEIVPHGLFADVQHLGDLAHRPALGHGEQGMDTLHQAQCTAGICLVEPAIQLLTQQGSEGYSEPHERYLLEKTLSDVLR